jgi:hypothetical protein
MGVSGGGGGGGQSSQGYDYTRQLQQSLQSIWGPQAQALSGMYGQTTGLLNQQMGQVPGAAQGLAGQVMPGAQAGLDLMQQYSNPNSQLAQSQLADYSQQVGQQFNREIMPGIRSQAGITGNMGGSRAALAQGVAAGDAATAIAQGGRDIYSHQYDLASQNAQLLPQLASQVYNLGMAPFASMWAPLTSAAGIFGGPTALSASQGQSLGESWNAGRGAPTKPTYGFNLF